VISKEEIVQQTAELTCCGCDDGHARAAEKNPLSNNAASVGASSAIGINRGGGLRGGLGLRKDGGDREE